MEYCPKCKKEVETTIVTKTERYNIYNDAIEVEARILTCGNCGKELYCKELDDVTLSNVYTKYRKKHNLLFHDEIKRIREEYNLTQSGLDKLLDWEEGTADRYESGVIQTEKHNNQLIELRDRENDYEKL